MRPAKKCTIFCSPSQNCSKKLGVLKNTAEMKCKNEFKVFKKHLIQFVVKNKGF